jgi:hypothetical protein
MRYKAYLLLLLGLMISSNLLAQNCNNKKTSWLTFVVQPQSKILVCEIDNGYQSCNGNIVTREQLHNGRYALTPATIGCPREVTKGMWTLGKYTGDRITRANAKEQSQLLQSLLIRQDESPSKKQ